MGYVDIPPPGSSQFNVQFGSGGSDGTAGSAQIQGTDNVAFEDYQLEQDYLEQSKQDSVDTFTYNLLEANPIAPGTTEHIQTTSSSTGGTTGTSGVGATTGTSGTGDADSTQYVTTSGTVTTGGVDASGGFQASLPKGNAWFSPNPAVAFLLAYQYVERLLERQTLSSSHVLQVEMNMSLANAKATAETDIDIGNAQATSLYDQGIIAATQAALDFFQMGVTLISMGASSRGCSTEVDEAAYNNDIYGDDDLADESLTDEAQENGIDFTSVKGYNNSFTSEYKASVNEQINSMSDDDLEANPWAKNYLSAKEAAFKKMQTFQNNITTNMQIFSQFGNNLTSSVSDFLQAKYKLLESQGEAEKSLLQGWQQIIQTSLQAQAQAFQNDVTLFDQVVQGFSKMIDANMQAYGYRIG